MMKNYKVQYEPSDEFVKLGYFTSARKLSKSEERNLTISEAHDELYPLDDEYQEYDAFVNMVVSAVLCAVGGVLAGYIGSFLVIIAVMIGYEVLRVGLAMIRGFKIARYVQDWKA